MISRSIDDDVLGPTLEERLFSAGKKISIALAIAAIGVATLDLMNASALTNISAAIRDGRQNYDQLPGRVLAGIRQISIYNDHSSVVVAIPRDAMPLKTLADARPAATLYDPTKPAPVAAERQRLALAKTDVKADVRPIEAARNQMMGQVKTQARPNDVVRSAPVARNNPAIAALSEVKHVDAVEMAMLQPDGELRAGLVAVSLTSQEAQISNPAAAVPQQPLSVSAQPNISPAVYAYDDVAPVRLASLNSSMVPSASLLPETAPITLPPLHLVPLPTAAPGVPPPSPAQRLNLDDKEYAKAQRCLANAIYWEARSEPVRGQMAVAQVVLNRVFSPFYPDDVCSVVYQNAHRHLSCQFTFACDGKRKTITERGHWARANRIAKQTLDGQIYVPEVAKSTHYHASYVNPIWNREMKKLVKFGLHSFYRPYAWGAGEDMPAWGKTAMAKHEPQKKK